MEDKQPNRSIKAQDVRNGVRLSTTAPSEMLSAADEQTPVATSEMTPTTAPQGMSVTRRKPLWRRRCLQKVGLATACLLAFNTAIALLLWQFLSPVTVSFDLNSTVKSFQEQMASQLSGEHPLTDTQIEAMTARFNQELSSSLERYQDAHRAIILVSPAVVGGVKDITSDIQDDIAKHMKD